MQVEVCIDSFTSSSKGTTEVCNVLKEVTGTNGFAIFFLYFNYFRDIDLTICFQDHKKQQNNEKVTVKHL